MNDLKNHIKNYGVIEIMPVSLNLDDNIPPPSPILRKSPRGVDCGRTNPPYETELKLKCEVQKLEDNKLIKKWYFTDLQDKKKNMTWWMCPETLDITWEATHLISPSVFYKDIYNIDFNILI